MVFAVSFAVYTLAIVALGVYSARYAKRSDEDYFLAGRSMGPWVAALSASASSESGWVTLGLVGWAFTGGFSAYWIIPGCLLGYVFNWLVLAGPLRERAEALGALTIPDLFAFGFRERYPILRILTVVVILTAMWLYVAAQFAAAGKAFSAAFEGLPYSAGAAIGAAIVLLYTVIGGFRAASWTDFAQAIIMLGTLVVFPVYLLVSLGGFDGVAERIGGVEPGFADFWPRKTGAALIGFLLGSGALGINFGYPGQPHIIVRFMAMREKGERRDALVAGVISITWAAMILWGAVTVGLVVRALMEDGVGWTGVLAAEVAAGVDGAGETGLVLAAKHMIPGVLSGMVLAAVLAAACSTADSQLMVAASAGANDLYARVFARSRRTAHLLVNRLVVFGLGLGALALVIDKEVQVFKYVLTYGWAVLGGALGPQVILLVFWRRATYAGCIAGMATGFATALVWPRVWPLVTERLDMEIEVYNLPLAFVVAMVVNVVVSVVVNTIKPSPPSP